MDTGSNKIAVGYAHSKLILLGEHAVVYGKPAIAIPFPLITTAVTEMSSEKIIFESEIYNGLQDSLPVNMQGISMCIKEVLSSLNKPYEGLRIKISSEIPLGRGLGSSAAVAAAIVKSLFLFYDEKLSMQELFKFVQISEGYAHGKPSGIDTATVMSESPILFQKNRKIINLKIGNPLYMVVGDTGVIGDTRKAVEKVREKYTFKTEEVKEILDKIEKIVEEAKNAIQYGNIDLLGELLNQNQEELLKLDISNEKLDKLIEKAKQAGALGAKLTGGGLGGCVVALAKSEEHAKVISDQLIKAGAVNSWCFQV